MTEQSNPLHSIIDSVGVVLFDFDGPLCDVFSGYPAHIIARELENIAGEPFDTDDPLEVLRQVAVRNNNKADTVEDALVAAEIRAVKCSSPNLSGVNALRACLDAGRQVGIVSNNSADAIVEFLRVQNLSAVVYPVIGRVHRRPDLMKPNTWPLREALDKVNRTPGQAVFIGDSISDVEAAKAVSMPCVAYANKPGKRELFASLGAVTIDSMHELDRAFAD